MRLGKPATTDRLRAWLTHYPGLRFKLDATSDWTEDLIQAELEDTGAVDSINSKGSITARASTRLPTPSCTSASSPAFPTPGWKIPP